MGPTHVAWHFYANDCRPASTGGDDNFQAKLDATAKIMEDYPFIQGAIVNEVGMLNCAMDTPSSACVPNGSTQQYPADQEPDNACSSTAELPNGLASFVEDLLGMVAATTTSDGRHSTRTWTVAPPTCVSSTRQVGEAYINSCQAWASTAKGINCRVR